MFCNYLSYGFGYGLRPKAEVFQGRTFGYGRRWKLCLRSNTGFTSTELVEQFQSSTWDKQWNFHTKMFWIIKHFILSIKKRGKFEKIQNFIFRIHFWIWWATFMVQNSMHIIYQFNLNLKSNQKYQFRRQWTKRGRGREAHAPQILVNTISTWRGRFWPPKYYIKCLSQIGLMY